MKNRILVACLLVLAAAGSASAGDILWFTGHNGADEGHTFIDAVFAAEGGVMDVVTTAPLPPLGGYTLVCICMPGFYNPTDFFTADEKARLNAWLTVGSHRVIPIGDWDGFYGGQDVMEDLLAAIGNPIVFVPGAWDSGCDHCAGPLGAADPLTAGLGHVCYGLTGTWNPSFGVPLAYPESAGAPGPYIVSNGTDIPCIVGIGDSNIITDLCAGHIGPLGDADTKEFARRLYRVTCAGEPQFACCLPEGRCAVLTREDCATAGGAFYLGMLCDDVTCEVTATQGATWGHIKATYR